MLWYCVCPVASKWAVTFDTQRRAFIYDTEDEALEAAKDAAERNWERHHVPSGVQVKKGKTWREVCRAEGDPPQMRCTPARPTRAACSEVLPVRIQPGADVLPA
ncbi:hypothetical protein GCM10027430_25080 [Lysobacter tyrosinilyticus]